MHRRLVFALGGVVLFAVAVLAQRPPENVSPKRHPNIAAAQRLVDQAFNKITAAQEANEFDLGGHAAKAKELLDAANKELKLAAEAANRH
ncbi:MAG TPA: hypothetical protein VLV86_23555 [Vicinamibacterales bacterium]|nr:hypothetical protein [Vicinamibacterales bacterium]